MDPPIGFPIEKEKVCKLKKALYVLKQSPRAWFDRLSRSIKVLSRPRLITPLCKRYSINLASTSSLSKPRQITLFSIKEMILTSLCE